MNKLGLIIKREFTTRIRNRAFIIMSFLGPVFFTAILIIPLWLTHTEEYKEKQIVVLVPDTVIFNKEIIPDRKTYKFQFVEYDHTGFIKQFINNTDYYGYVVIPSNLFSVYTIEYHTKNKQDHLIRMHITRSLEEFIQEEKLLALEKTITRNTLDSAQSRINIDVFEKGNINTNKMAVAYISGFLIYFFIFFFSSRVMRGVVEEKTNRIVEIMISSVKPVQLMLGKIIGLGLVGLVQFLLWMMLTIGFYQLGTNTFIDTHTIEEKISDTEKTIHSPRDLFSASPDDQQQYESLIRENKADSISDNLEFLEPGPGILIGLFIIYFILGYLLYSSIFAAIGSAVDSDTDTQQFMLPVTLPLIVALMVMLNTITDPGGQLARIFSYIPFTSPIVMMARIPFGWDYVSGSEIISSLIILLITFFVCLWMSAKIYRVGILMYGKKTSFRELFRWIRYRN